jgi:ABC-2 type transport system permease protein
MNEQKRPMQVDRESGPLEIAAPVGLNPNVPAAPASALAGSGFWRRLWALVRKEVRQLLRDPGNLGVGMGLPIILILLFGYGLSMDSSSASQELIAGLGGSPVLRPVVVRSMAQAEQLLNAQQVDAIVQIPPDYAARAQAGQAHAQLIVNGVDANRARLVMGYVQTALSQAALRQLDRSGADAATLPGRIGQAGIDPRVWFNAANSSTWYLVPGLVVIIMTLVGAFLTALVMAREWERGTLESLFVTPVRPIEILLGKIIPYFGVGMVGLILCMGAARWLFHVPVHGSLPILLGVSMLYLLVALGMGLVISSITRSQFLASQLALLLSFLPALMLSGFLFDLRSVPVVVRLVGNLLPATYYVELLKNLFLAGNVWPVILKNSAVLLGYATLFLLLALRHTRKQLKG